MKFAPSRPLLKGALMAVIFASLTTFSSRADTYLSTMGIDNDELTGTVSSFLSTGFAFTTDDQAYRMDSLTARFFVGTLGPVATYDLNASIYSAGSNGYPVGSALGTFSHPTLFSSYATNITFTANGVIELAANSSYIFVLAPVGSGVDGVEWYAREAVPSGEGWNAINGIFYQALGGSWHNEQAGAYVFMASIEAVAVPEPSTWVLMMGVGIFFVWRGVRRDKAGNVC